MSNKIDKLFRQVFQKEHFEFKDAYFEAFMSQNMGRKMSFFARNRSLILVFTGFIFLATSSFGIYHFGKKNLSNQIAQNPTEITQTESKTTSKQTKTASAQTNDQTASQSGKSKSIHTTANQNELNTDLPGKHQSESVPTKPADLEKESAVTSPQVKSLAAAPRGQTVEPNIAAGNSGKSSPNNAQGLIAMSVLANDDKTEESPLTKGNGQASATEPYKGAQMGLNGSEWSLEMSTTSTTDASLSPKMLDSAALSITVNDVCLLDGTMSGDYGTPSLKIGDNHLFIKNRHSSMWFLGITTQYNFFNKAPFGESSVYTQTRLDAEQLTNHLSYGVYFKNIRRQLSFGGQLLHGSMDEQINYQVSETPEYRVDTLRIMVNPKHLESLLHDGGYAGLIRHEYDSVLTGYKVDSLSQHKLNTFKYIEMPLTIGYHHSIGRVNFELQVGFSAMYIYQYEGLYMSDEMEAPVSLEQNISRLSLRPMAGLDVNYQLGSRYLLGLNAQYKLPNQSSINHDTYFGWRQLSFGSYLALRL